MNVTTATTRPAGESARRSGPAASRIDRLSRELLLKRLAKLRSGRIEIADEFGQTLLGRDEEDAQPCRVAVRDLRFYRQAIRGGGLAVAEAYMRGAWEADDLTALLRLFVRNIKLAHGMDAGASRLTRLMHRAAHCLNRNSLKGSRRNIGAHYDLGNDFFRLMLDETMTYSSGIFESAHSTMRDASLAKLDRICRKLDLQSHHHLLEIGTGWGSFAMHAARHFGCRVTTTTISRRQHELATSRIEEAGLADRVRVLLKDYRELDERFDRIASIEMIEAVGHDHLAVYFAQCSKLLKPDGLMALQAITMPDWRYESYRRSVDFIQRYVFPGSCCPSIGAMTHAMAKESDLRMFHLEDISPHYAQTLRTWRRTFLANIRSVRDLGYDERFIRMWLYYLSYCEAGFAERYTGLVQVLLTKPNAAPEPMLAALNRERSAAV